MNDPNQHAETEAEASTQPPTAPDPPPFAPDEHLLVESMRHSDTEETATRPAANPNTR